MLRFVTVLVVSLLVSLAHGVARAEAISSPSQPLVLLARLNDEPITPGTARYLERAIRQAEEQQAECLVVVLDTPGGLLDATRTIVKHILASQTSVVVYVAPAGARAASAGVFITLSAHFAAMAPGTTIGAAHPVQVGDLPIQTPRQERPTEETTSDRGKKDTAPSREPLQEKIVNDTVAWARALAEQRHRNAEWAARAVSESLSVTATKAVEEQVVDFEAVDLPQLLHKLDGRKVLLPQGMHTLTTSSAGVRELPMWWGEEVLAVISRPNVAFLLLIFGFYGILFELYSPTWGVSGTLGVVCLLLAFYGLAVLPVNYLGLLLIGVALTLFVAELKVASHGALALAGTTCLVLGGVMLVESPVGFSRVSLGVILPLAAATATITLFLLGGVMRVHRQRVQTGDESLVGVIARARTDFTQDGDHYSGMVFMHGEWWKAISESPLTAGQECKVLGRHDLTLIVSPRDTPTPPTSIPREKETLT
jgi:membrane-bound serine protease (ClpP class)